jgi:hypothetical protein
MAVLEEHVQHPDPGSEFEKTVESLGQLQPREKLVRLMQMGFDALITFNTVEMVGFSAIRRDTAQQATHVIRIYTYEKYRRNGAGLSALTRIVEDAFGKGHVLVQAGKGKDKYMTALLTAFKKKYEGKHRINVDVLTGRIEAMK